MYIAGKMVAGDVGGMSGEIEAGSLREHHDSEFHELNLLQASLSGLDERGLILSLAAFAEDSLGALLKAFLVPTDATKSLLDGFNAPLGTFSARIRAAYAMGLVTKDQYEDLEHLRKIRNAFSHTWKPISFSDQSIADHIKAINYSNADDEFPENAMEKIRVAIAFLLVELKVIKAQIAKNGTRAKVIGTRLISGLSGDASEQIEGARAKIAALETDIGVAVGEKRAFLLKLRQRWLDRLTIIGWNCPADRQHEIVQMRSDLMRRISAES